MMALGRSSNFKIWYDQKYHPRNRKTLCIQKKTTTISFVLGHFLSQKIDTCSTYDARYWERLCTPRPVRPPSRQRWASDKLPESLHSRCRVYVKNCPESKSGRKVHFGSSIRPFLVMMNVWHLGRYSLEGRRQHAPATQPGPSVRLKNDHENWFIAVKDILKIQLL